MTNQICQPIRTRLREARANAQLSQEDVASHFRLSRQAISKWEREGGLPTTLQFRELGLLYGVSLDYLIYGIRTMPASRGAVISEVFRIHASVKGPVSA